MGRKQGFRQTEQYEGVAGVLVLFLVKDFALKVMNMSLDGNIKKISNGKINKPKASHLCLVQGDKSIFKLSLDLHSKEGRGPQSSTSTSGKKELIGALSITASP